MRPVRILLLGVAVVQGGCGSLLAASVHGTPRPLSDQLLAAYLRPADDFDRSPDRFCADFTPAVAARIAARGHASTCPRRMVRVVQVDSSTGPPGLAAAAARRFHERMVSIVRSGDRATALLSIDGQRNKRRLHFRLISGRWRVAEVPTVTAHATRCGGHSLGCSATSSFFIY